MEEMYEEQINKYEIGYTKFNEIAVCQNITWKYAKPPYEEIRIRFDGIGIHIQVDNFDIQKLNSEYNNIMDLKNRYIWVEVPYQIYKHMLQYISEHSPF